MFSSQLSRVALLYLLTAFVLCNVLLVVFLPWWLFLVAAGCLMWRLLIFYGRASFPAAWLRSTLVLLSGVVLLAQYGFSLSINVFVTLLILGFSLKLLEIYQKQDAQVLLYLSLFALMTTFLFSQAIVYALLVFCVVIFVLAAMVAVQSDGIVLSSNAWHPLRRGFWLFLAALPVMLFMFVVMPRLPPLWSMPLKTQQAKTGMSDRMKLGDVAALAQSSDIAFRASFPQGVPPRASLYWYGLFLDRFDGESWSESCNSCLSSLPSGSTQQQSLPYQVVLEASGQPWVYLLKPSVIRNARMKEKPDGMVRYTDSVRERRMYDAQLLPSTTITQLNATERLQYLALPKQGNAEARTLALQWKNQSKNNDEILQSAINFYHASFRYTLQPPLLQGDRIDDFLFNTRSGFCEHFAGSFVFLMRAAGIPARVAVGYMGGEVDSKNGFVVVRQYDAHAWAEVWLSNRGWVRVDPTAAVAPERIDLGFEAAYASNPLFANGANIFQSRRFSLLNRIRIEMDRFDYTWSRWVLEYRDERQSLLLQKLGFISPLKIALWGAVGIALIFFGVCIYLLWRERRNTHEHPATRHYRRVCEAYARLGVARLVMESPMQYAKRIGAEEVFGAEQFERLSSDYYAWVYAGNAANQSLPSECFIRQCCRLRYQLFFR